MRENNPRRNSGDRRDRRFDTRREPRAAAPAPVEEEDEGRLEGPLVERYLEPGGLFPTMHGRVTAPSC